MTSQPVHTVTLPQSDPRLASSSATLTNELATFVHAVLADTSDGDLQRVALEVFNTVVSDLSSRDSIARKVLANHLNVIGPLAHAAGPVGRRPIFMLHGGDGEVGWFLRHLTALELTRPVYGLTAPGWYGETMPTSISLQAARYLKVMRSLQPYGPYTIGGYCAGTRVAVEMAQQLESCGQEVDVLLLIDPGVYRGLTTITDIVAFRMRQLRQRRHPVMEPYFAFADQTSADDVISTLAGPGLPSPPIARRFYRGLLVLIGVLVAEPAPPQAVSASACLVLNERLHDRAPGSNELLLKDPGNIIHGSITKNVISGTHGTMFEQPALHQLIANLRSD